MRKEQVKQEVNAMVEIIRLYESYDKPPIPWKFAIEDNDSYWPVKWLLYPVDGEIWIVKRRSPDNIYAEEQMDLVGVKINGELVFIEAEWNNEIIAIWNRKNILNLFEKVARGKYSGVAIEDNWRIEDKEKAEKWHRIMWVIRMLLEDSDSLKNYGELTFRRYVERYYSKWLMEFKDLFEVLAKMEGSDRERFLKNLKCDLESEGFKEGFFMYVYYP